MPRKKDAAQATPDPASTRTAARDRTTQVIRFKVGLQLLEQVRRRASEVRRHDRPA